MIRTFSIALIVSIASSVTFGSDLQPKSPSAANHVHGTLTYTGKDITCVQMEAVIRYTPLFQKAKMKPPKCHEVLPAWIEKLMAEEIASHSVSVIEESRYGGKTVFEINEGIPDSGDEHRLYSADQKEICRFGGFVGHVSSGVCDIAKIEYVRTLYDGTNK